MTKQGRALEQETAYQLGQMTWCVEKLLDIFDAHALSVTLMAHEQDIMSVVRSSVASVMPKSRHAKPTMEPRGSQTVGGTH